MEEKQRFLEIKSQINQISAGRTVMAKLALNHSLFVTTTKTHDAVFPPFFKSMLLCPKASHSLDPSLMSSFYLADQSKPVIRAPSQSEASLQMCAGLVLESLFLKSGNNSLVFS